jgi:PIN domain nuclease of toxin-antitoxin system
MDEMFREIEFHPLTILPLACSVAAESVRLRDDFHRNPADQIIIATACCHNLTLITADDRIRNWGKVRVL